MLCWNYYKRLFLRMKNKKKYIQKKITLRNKLGNAFARKSYNSLAPKHPSKPGTVIIRVAAPLSSTQRTNIQRTNTQRTNSEGASDVRGLNKVELSAGFEVRVWASQSSLKSAFNLVWMSCLEFLCATLGV